MKIIAAILRALYSSPKILELVPLDDIASEAMDFLKKTPKYIGYAVFIFLIFFNSFYFIYGLELKTFCLAKNLERKKQYLAMWNDCHFFYARIFFRIIFAVVNVHVMQQPRYLQELAYDQHLNHKLNYDQKHCRPA